MPSLTDQIEQLPPELKQEVRNFVEILLEKRENRSETELQLDWRGALEDLNQKYTSVELEQKSLQWWNV